MITKRESGSRRKNANQGGEGDGQKLKPAEDAPRRTQKSAITISDLDKLLSGRRQLSAGEKAQLLGQINLLRRGPLNNPEAAGALLSIAASGAFLCFGGEWRDFFHKALEWSAGDGQRVLKLYEANRWAEVVSQPARDLDLEESGHALVREQGSLPQMDSQQDSEEIIVTTDTPVEPECGESAARNIGEVDAATEIEQAMTNAARLVSADLVPSAGLSEREEALLGKCEAIITENAQALFQIGEALRQIRDGKLYRRDYRTFEAYCRGRWNFTKAWAYAQLKCVDVRDNLSTIGGQTQEPVNERQLRPLASLNPDQQRAAWSRAEELADGGTISSGHVSRAVKELLGISTATKAGPAFDPDAAWNKIEKMLNRQVKLWPTEAHGDLAERVETFLIENFNRRPVDE